MKSLNKFFQYYKPYRGLFFADMFCALLLSAIDLIFPIIVRFLLNDVYVLKNENKILKYVFIIGAALLIMYIVRYFCQYFITSWGHIMGAKMEANMRKDLFNQFQKLPFSYYDNNNTGTLMSRIITDLFDISELAHHGPEDLFISILKIVGSFIILSSINLPITLVLLVITLGMVYFSVFYNRKMKHVFMRNRKEIAEVNAVVQDSLAGIRVVKSFANENVEEKKFKKGNKQFLKTKEESYFIMGKYYSGNGFFQGILYLAAILFGGILISKSLLSVSDLVIYILYINIFLNPIDKLVNFTEQFQRGITGFERFLQVINTKPAIVDKEDAIEVFNPRGSIKFNNVSFGYDDKNDVLKDIDIEISAGKNIALVGPSGGGKTTFCNLIPRFYEATKGDITIDGIDIKDIKLNSLRNAIGLVQQDVYMFGGTIKENIAYGKQDATDEDIIEAAKRANIHEFIENLEYGYETHVGERGVKLSGGQKQRISIARVFLKNPPILILDEATSALDNESERFIQQSLEELSKNRTTIVIAHRLSTIRNSDQIIVLTDNGVKEKGSHKELIAKNGLYATLYNMQFDILK
ncbi:ABC transporter ATP-binding protein/permease [Clostridium pasteurianum DSM 525 = ATCC 6013]|uniref:ABC transporter ATP-binding protein/permease n=1 Tax=Clostridium pasteurianum DSM 525 = ATCC 6013 TaxID=1262449 RepID=A0A0H3J496_CLOPA|nr:ABC transporter ATP-binding protein [Clostridium pasteurianum]AJA48761.1 ABC transporter ATP-binding protein/permease [Clostridium pasteurianum DSM 525 = ATCC 6013]AJA52749.1 ABC transporter ATP-binding protein/permease [Clostridium pasteurianum DSM 525 = ATCC 6013]AOZ75984.1 thiamine ABC transporter permease [Clostridium pasteurianum DSM 525 = ATCC 6013]AOZ79780.1 thiamine ABC transporter permease [Clostridium pasteurianum]ELP60060.1 multidrug resistance ABC transporter ATP-binding and per